MKQVIKAALLSALSLVSVLTYALEGTNMGEPGQPDAIESQGITTPQTGQQIGQANKGVIPNEPNQAGQAGQTYQGSTNSSSPTTMNKPGY